MKKALAVFLSLTLVVQPAVVHASVLPGGINLPPAGQMVGFSSPMQPVLLRGVTIFPDQPLKFDFIVDPGAQTVTDQVLRNESQRMVNYFLAALTIPQQDLWVNLSPVEKDRIVPDTLIRTELGRDLLAQDYMLKQLTASLIYPEDQLGQGFWQRIYAEAYKKFGVTDVPVDVFNKVWIIPETASVFEKGNTVYIAKAHMKVQLDADHQAQGLTTDLKTINHSNQPAVGEMTKQILREVLLPAIEKEVNEGANFARLRQVVYSMILAQWYQDVLKEGVINKTYSGKSKMAGIDLSDPKNKQLIYDQYMAAYKTGVFNYIKEENDRVSNEIMPKKYFSGGFQGAEISRVQAPLSSASGFDEAMSVVRVDIKQAEVDAAEASLDWRVFSRSGNILLEMKEILNEENPDNRLVAFFKKYSKQIDIEKRKGNPVQSVWTITKAFVFLPSKQRKYVVKWIQNILPQDRTKLMADILLLEGAYDKNWVAENVSELVKATYFFLTMELDLKIGGLGPVNGTHTKFLSHLGVAVRAIQPLYQLRFDTGVPGGAPVDYARDLGVTGLHLVHKMIVKIGEELVNAEVWEGVNRDGVTNNYIRDVQADGSSKYANRTYGYKTWENPDGLVTIEESMAFFSQASAQWMEIYQDEKKAASPENEYQPIVVALQDGQAGPTAGVIKSRNHPGLRESVYVATTHTIANVGEGPISNVKGVLTDMMGITPRWTPAYVMDTYFSESGTVEYKGPYVQYTAGMITIADVANGVSWSHADDMSKWYNRRLQGITNGDDPVVISSFHRQALANVQARNQIHEGVTVENLSPEQEILVKAEAARMFNDMRVVTANGEKLVNEAKARFGKTLGELSDDQKDEIISWANTTHDMTIQSRDELVNGFVVNVDPNAPTIVAFRRGVYEKNAFNFDLIQRVVALGFNVVFGGNEQSSDSSKDLVKAFASIEKKINKDRKAALAMGMPDPYPGRFFFVSHFPEKIKIAALGMGHWYWMMNKKSKGAHEVLEENPLPNGMGMIALNHRDGHGDGGTTDPFLPIDFARPGSGNLIMLDPNDVYNNLEKVINEAFRPLMDLWKNDKLGFFRNIALGPTLNPIQGGQLTAAEYARQANQELVDRKIYKARNLITADRVLALLDEKARSMALNDLPGKEDKRYVFNFKHDPSITAGSGLTGFLQTIEAIKDKFGFHSLFGEMHNFKEYVIDLFTGSLEYRQDDFKDGYTPERLLNVIVSSGYNISEYSDSLKKLNDVLRSDDFRVKFLSEANNLTLADENGKQVLFKRVTNYSSLKSELIGWFDSWESEENQREMKKDEILTSFFDFLQEGLINPDVIKTKLKASGLGEGATETAAIDAAQRQGGIDARNIGVNRSGELMPGVVSDRAMEALLANAPGLRGIIVSITPLTGLRKVLGM